MMEPWKQRMQLRTMNVTEVYVCEKCGRELKVLRAAGNSQASEAASTAAQAVGSYMCCGQPMKLKPAEPPAPEPPR